MSIFYKIFFYNLLKSQNYQKKLKIIKVIQNFCNKIKYSKEMIEIIEEI